MDDPHHQEDAEFEHDTLPDASKYIRLVEVLQGNHSEAFQARFRMSTWRIDGLPPYQAISYTWGDPQSSRAIRINGKTFRVRKNCEIALKQAWRYRNNDYYWIDAICINQANDEEKGKQVAMMGNIYKTAYKVLACVGDHADDSLFLYRHLASTNRFSERLPNFPKTRDLLRQTHKLLTIRRYLRAAVHFAKRPYFSRLWIAQELKLARQANVLCGADALPKNRIWRLFRGLITSAIFFRYPWISTMSRLRQWNVRAMFYRRSSFDHHLEIELRNAYFVTHDSSQDFLWVGSSALQCTQKRDRIYGIMPLIDWGAIVPPIPDYTKSDFDVASDFVQPMVELEHSKGEINGEFVCSRIARALELSVRSDSVSGALEARRVVHERDFAGFSMPVNPPPSQLQSQAKGWHLSGEHFISRRQPTSSEWKVPNHPEATAVLPHWFREGDWILQPDDDCVRKHLWVLREVAGGIYSPILGHGRLISGSIGTWARPDATFRIFWDTEDLLVHTIMVDEWKNIGMSPLEFGVCKRETPGSSFAVQQNYPRYC